VLQHDLERFFMVHFIEPILGVRMDPPTVRQAGFLLPPGFTDRPRRSYQAATGLLRKSKYDKIPDLRCVGRRFPVAERAAPSHLRIASNRSGLSALRSRPLD